MKLIVLNRHDNKKLKMAMNTKSDLLLMQDATLFCNKKRKDAPTFGERNIFALKIDLEKRGLSDKIIEGIVLVNYDEIVDLFFSQYTVVNL